jgi:hypothetical protein
MADKKKDSKTKDEVFVNPVTKKRVGMTKQWACKLCNFPENFTYECSMCGTYNEKAKPE